MPGVSQSLWVLLALGLNVSEGFQGPHRFLGGKSARAAAVCLLGVWLLFVLVVVWPVTASVSTLTLGRQLFAYRDGAGAEAQFRLAAVQDPLWSEPWVELSRIHYERWLASRGRSSEEQFDHAVAAIKEAQRLAPSRLEPVRLLAGLYEAKAERGARESMFWAKAAEAYRGCVKIYPTSASLHAHLARALWQSGELDAARDMARRARQLDVQTPHSDRKLTEADRKLIEALQDPQAPVE
jgi:tetratricopeptide (TPR) repeat protein